MRLGLGLGLSDLSGDESPGLGFILLETGDFLLQEDGSKLIYT